MLPNLIACLLLWRIKEWGSFRNVYLYNLCFWFHFFWFSGAEKLSFIWTIPGQILLLFITLGYQSRRRIVRMRVRAHRVETIMDLVLQRFSADWIYHTVTSHNQLNSCRLGYFLLPISGLLSGGNWAICTANFCFSSFSLFLPNVMLTLGKKFLWWL